MEKHFMNKQHGEHMKQGASEHHGEGGGKPSIHIHSHSAGHTVHIMHPDGRHEQHEHEHGDAEGIAQHVHEHLGAGGEEHEPEGFHDDDEQDGLEPTY